MLLLCWTAACSEPPSGPERLRELVRATRPTGLQILLVGIDGADLRVIEPLIAAGRLPTLARLISGGAHGVLGSDPPLRSPAIWTTIATGRGRREHGIEKFRRPGSPNQLVTSADRKISALWNQVGAFGKTVGFLGWWATWPAEPVNGWMVSDRLTRTRWREWLHAEAGHGVTFPAELVDELEPLLVSPDSPPLDEIAALVDLDDDELAELQSARRPIFGHGLSVFKFAFCAQRSYEEAALHLLSRKQPDLMGVLLAANDAISHTFWHFYEPEAFSGVDPERARRLGRLIPALYEHNDRYLERLLRVADPGTVVIVVSDHGFQASGTLPVQVAGKTYPELRAGADGNGTVAVGQSGRHRGEGVLIAHGPAVRAGVRVRASIFDVAPTILALLGLPVAADMEGRVLTGLIEPDFLEAHPIRTIRSYEDYLERQALIVADDPDYRRIEQLRALGYLE